MTGYIKYQTPEDIEIELELSQVDQITQTPRYSPDDVNVSHIDVAMRVLCRFSAPTTEEFITKLDQIEQGLNTPRGILTIATAAGAPDAETWYNIQFSEDRDIDTGPKPRGVDIRRNTAGLLAWITWDVEFTVLCRDQPSANDAPDVLYKSYSTNYSFDNDGTLVRTIEGEAQIADSTDAVNGVHGRSAQQVINDVYVRVPPQWRRTSANFSISPNGLVLRYRFVDQELEVGWNDLVASMSLNWRENQTLYPLGQDGYRRVTLSARIKGKHRVKKRTLYQQVIVPLLDGRYRNAGGGQGVLVSFDYSENILDNLIEVVVVKMIKPSKGDVAALSVGEFPPPSPAFGQRDLIISLNSTTAGPGGGQQTSFDPITLESINGSESARSRWQSFPILTRLVIAGLCNRTPLDPPPGYDAATSTLTLEIEDESNPPLDDFSQEDLTPTAESDLYRDDVLTDGGYMTDREQMELRVDQGVYTVGNSNQVTVDAAGELRLENERSQRKYQSDLPSIRLVVVGVAIRIDGEPEPKTVPTIIRKSDNTEVKMFTDKMMIRNFGPVPLEGGIVPGYGVMWRYEMLLDLKADDYEIDPQTAITNLRILRRPTRESREFSNTAMQPLQFGDPFR